MALGDSEAARQALMRSLSLRPGQPMACKVLAAISFSRGEERAGLQYLARAAALDPEDFRPWYAIGEANLRFGHMEDAMPAFRAALKRSPDHEESRIGLLAVLLATRRPEESADLVAGLLRDKPESLQVQVLAARHAMNSGDAATAIRHAEKVLQLDPDRAEALVIRARLYRMSGKLLAALADAEHAVRVDNTNAPAVALLAQLQQAAGKTTESRATMARHQALVQQSEQLSEIRDEIGRRPDDPLVRCKLGQAARDAGAMSLAKESYRAVLLPESELPGSCCSASHTRSKGRWIERQAGSALTIAAKGATAIPMHP